MKRFLLILALSILPFSTTNAQGIGVTSGERTALLEVADSNARTLLAPSSSKGRIVKQNNDSSLWLQKPDGTWSQLPSGSGGSGVPAGLLVVQDKAEREALTYATVGTKTVYERKTQTEWRMQTDGTWEVSVLSNRLYFPNLTNQLFKATSGGLSNILHMASIGDSIGGIGGMIATQMGAKVGRAGLGIGGTQKMLFDSTGYIDTNNPAHATRMNAVVKGDPTKWINHRYYELAAASGQVIIYGYMDPALTGITNFRPVISNKGIVLHLKNPSGGTYKISYSTNFDPTSLSATNGTWVDAVASVDTANAGGEIGAYTDFTVPLEFNFIKITALTGVVDVIDPVIYNDNLATSPKQIGGGVILHNIHRSGAEGTTNLQCPSAIYQPILNRLGIRFWVHAKNDSIAGINGYTSANDVLFTTNQEVVQFGAANADHLIMTCNPEQGGGGANDDINLIKTGHELKKYAIANGYSYFFTHLATGDYNNAVISGMVQDGMHLTNTGGYYVAAQIVNGMNLDTLKRDSQTDDFQPANPYYLPQTTRGVKNTGYNANGAWEIWGNNYAELRFGIGASPAGSLVQGKNGTIAIATTDGNNSISTNGSTVILGSGGYVKGAPVAVAPYSFVEAISSSSGRPTMSFHTPTNASGEYNTDAVPFYTANVRRVSFRGNGTLRFEDTTAGLEFKTGTNARSGTSTLVAGTVTVANTNVTAGDFILVNLSATGGTGGTRYLPTITAGTGFTLTAINASGATVTTDTSTLKWVIIRQN